MSTIKDTDRLRAEYVRRDAATALDRKYSVFDVSYLFGIQQRERDIRKLLRACGVNDVGSKRILEVGCGRGGVLLDFVRMGARPANCWGIDLLPDRIEETSERLPHAHLNVGDASHLPYDRGSFDLVLQFTAFSSILDDAVRERMANEMLRVLAGDGMIVWYDFWLNPTNPQTRGVGLGEVKRLFPGCGYWSRRITLAPPIARCVVPLSWTIGLLFESIKLLNSHYLVGIRTRPVSE